MRPVFAVSGLLALVCASFLVAGCSRSRSQATPTLPVVQAAPPTSTGAKSGLELLREGNELLQDEPKGESLAQENLSPEERVRRQRLAVERNAPALNKLREALRADISKSAILPEGTVVNFRLNADVRQFGRLLVHEADVRAADGDILGAAHSSLDALELGAQVGRGSLIQWMVGAAISQLGRQSLQQHAPPLNVAQSREVAARLEALLAASPSFADVLRGEENSNVALFMKTVKAPTWKPELEANLKQTDPKKRSFSPERTKQLLALSPDQIEANVRRASQTAIEQAKLPYQEAKRAPKIRAADALSQMAIPQLLKLNRFLFERDVVASRLILAALQLRAHKLETGTYPDTFDAGADPFSPTLAPLIYKRDGDSYLLYSVGPDGKDDGGSEIQTLEKNKETGVTRVSNRLAPDSTGDIVAPIL